MARPRITGAREETIADLREEFLDRCRAKNLSVRTIGDLLPHRPEVPGAQAVLICVESGTWVPAVSMSPSTRSTLRSLLAWRIVLGSPTERWPDRSCPPRSMMPTLIPAR